MFELPEFLTLARQMNATIRGKVVRSGRLGNSPHKFVWYNRSPDEFAKLAAEKTTGEARARGKWLFLPLQPGYLLVLGEFGGKVLYHSPGSPPPQKYHLLLEFEDGSYFSGMTQMWGAVELYQAGEEYNRQSIRDMRVTPSEAEFTFDYFTSLIDSLPPADKRSVKGLLTQEQLIPGLGNAIAQDIMFRARLHPRRPIAGLSPEERRCLYEAVVGTVREAMEKGGRYDEVDLYGNPGKYTRLMDKTALDRPCPGCGGKIQKFQYLGGTCYICPSCQN